MRSSFDSQNCESAIIFHVVVYHWSLTTHVCSRS